MSQFGQVSVAPFLSDDDDVNLKVSSKVRMDPMEFIAGHASADARITILSRGITADATSVYLVDDNGFSVLKVSPPEFPNVIRDLTRKLRDARKTLGNTLGKCIPTPLDEWDVDGVSCASFELLRPLSDVKLKRLLQVKAIRKPVLKWLRNIATIDHGPAQQAESCLNAIAQCPCEHLHEPAREALARLKTGAFAARATVMHGDLTLGNVLLDPTRSREFVIIDWRGSSVRGFPIFDLVKFAEGARFSRAMLRTELAAHADLLDCELIDTRSYLLAAFGHIWLNLGEFPAARFAEMTRRNLTTLNRALNFKLH